MARKLVAYLMAADRRQTHFLVADRETCAVASAKDFFKRVACQGLAVKPMSLSQPQSA